MTINDPNSTRTTEVRHTYGAAIDPAVVHTTEVRDNSAGWWLGALVAIVAILAVVFLVTREPTASPEEEIARAMEASRTEAALANAQMSMNQAALSAQDTANRAAASAAMAASEATARAEAAAREASRAAADASLRPPAPTPAPAPAAPTVIISPPVEPLPSVQ